MQHIFIITGILLSFMSAFYTANLLAKSDVYEQLLHRTQRINVLDGLRGYLAMGVFAHHSIMYFTYLSTGEYIRPEYDYAENLGKVSVAIFFMITGFLFTHKLLKLGRDVQWYSLFKSRVFRLMPLYIFVVAMISCIVYLESNGQLRVSHYELFKDYIKWALFHGDTINNYQSTGMIISGVDWSLKYEWLFYLALPLIAVTLRLNSLLLFIIIGLLCIAGGLYPDYYFTFNSRYMMLFFIGSLVAKIQYQSGADHKIKTSAAITLFWLLLTINLLYSETFDVLHSIMIGIWFYLLVTKQVEVKLFTHKASVVLGEISYSIYLLHGIVLYCLFYAHDQLHELGNMPLSYFIFVMPIMSVLVVLISHCSFRYIELPGMALAKHPLLQLNHRKLHTTKYSNISS